MLFNWAMQVMFLQDDYAFINAIIFMVILCILVAQY